MIKITKMAYYNQIQNNYLKNSSQIKTKHVAHHSCPLAKDKTREILVGKCARIRMLYFFSFIPISIWVHHKNITYMDDGKETNVGTDDKEKDRNKNRLNDAMINDKK